MTARRAAAALVAGVIGASLGPARPAQAEPSDAELTWLGVGLALPTYALGVSLHEGSHALAATLVGAEVLSLSVLPGRDPQTGAFHFGLTRVRGLGSRGNKLFFYLAPKLTNTVLLAGFTGLVVSDAWPDNRYGQLTLSVLATGLWVDFSKDVLSFSPHNDVVKAMSLCGLRSEWARLPVRLGYATLAVTWAFFVARGYQRTFADPSAPSAPAAQARVWPMWSTRF